MDFSAFPPEINSARMYSGPGSGPMLAAAAAWDHLAHGLNSSASACRSVIAGLTVDGWQGSSALAMTDAVTRYVAWMHSTASHAEQTAAQARAAAAAYQAAFAMTVPPPLIATNRAQLQALITSNFFGQNSPAIAATEADYERMWAQDASTMDSYAASASTVSKLPAFIGPPSVVQQPIAAAVPPTQGLDLSSLLNSLLAIPAVLSATASTSSSSFSGAAIITTNHALAVNALRDESQGIGPFWIRSTAPPAATGHGPASGSGVSALLGRASLAGRLSVPQAWAATTTPPAVTLASGTVPAAGAVAAPEVPAAVSPGIFGEAMLGTLAGRGVNNAAAKLRRPSVIPRSPAAG